MSVTEELNKQLEKQKIISGNRDEINAYNNLRLKKHLQDMKILVQQKTAEIEELQKNSKTTKVHELQEELQIY